MSDEFLACPRCACLKFYVRGNQEKMIFFQINAHLQPVATGVSAADLSHTVFSPIYCAGCSWSGEIKDLAN